MQQKSCLDYCREYCHNFSRTFSQNTSGILAINKAEIIAIIYASRIACQDHDDLC